MSSTFIDTVNEIIVIHLPQRKDRLESFEANSNNLCKPFTVFPSFDNKLTQLGDSANTHVWMGFGYIGCYLSHLAVIKYCLAKKLDRVMIFEDDVIVPPGFNRRLDMLTAGLVTDWDMIYLHYGASNVDGKNSFKYQVGDEIYRANYIGSTAGYMLNASGIEKLHAILQRKITKHIDHTIADYMSGNDDFLAYYFSPSPVEIHPDMGTDNN